MLRHEHNCNGRNDALFPTDFPERVDVTFADSDYKWNIWRHGLVRIDVHGERDEPDVRTNLTRDACSRLHVLVAGLRSSLLLPDEMRKCESQLGITFWNLKLLLFV